VARAAPLFLVGLLGLCGLAGEVGPAAASASSDSPLAALLVNIPGSTFTLQMQGTFLSDDYNTAAPRPFSLATVIALIRLSDSASTQTYRKVWQGSERNDEIEDVLVKFPTVGGARAFLAAEQQALAIDVVQSTPLPSMDGARLTTYADSSPISGSGQAIAMRSGTYVATMSYFTGAGAADVLPISPTAAVDLARAQYSLIDHAPGGGLDPNPSRAWVTMLGWAAVAVVLVVAMAVAILGMRRLRGARPKKVTGVVHRISDGVASSHRGPPVVARSGR
jgi:hypothetical protein